MLQSCASLGADCVILDLEDAVAPRHKDEARRLVVYALRCLPFGDVGKVVRINDVSTPWWEADLVEVIPANPDVIRLPKVESTMTFVRLIVKYQSSRGLMDCPKAVLSFISCWNRHGP